jgi:hypothetical protein
VLGAVGFVLMVVFGVIGSQGLPAVMDRTGIH